MILLTYCVWTFLKNVKKIRAKNQVYYRNKKMHSVEKSELLEKKELVLL